MKLFSQRIVPIALLMSIALSTSAATITNGDFSAGSAGWSTDTDGFPGSSNDFFFNGDNARIEADYWSVPGDAFSIPFNDVFFANTLYQEMDTTADPGDTLTLSFDWAFGGEGVSDDPANEYFFAGINDGLGNYYGADGSLGFLIDSTQTYGNGSFSAELDYSTFANSAGWFLDFQIGVGVDPNTFWNDALGSYLEIDNVSLVAEGIDASVPVPEPGALYLFCSSLLTLLTIRRIRSLKR